MHPACLDPDELAKECRVRFSRASGPGGQHRNKVETSVVVEHLPSGLEAQASEARQQGENRQIAMHRLRCALAVGLRSEASSSLSHQELSPTGPSEAWLRYCRAGRLRVAETNPDYPRLLAEALDRLASCDWDPSTAAQQLVTSATQLVRLLAQYPPALEELNRQLEQRGRSPRTRNRG
jgi:hypothetical protein